MILCDDVTSSEVCRMPESPSAVKQHLAAPSSGRSSAPISSHKVSSGMNGSHSPHSSTPSGRTPSPPGAAPVSERGPPNGPPPPDLAIGVRPLSKLKRFLNTVQQFGTDISPDTGDRMHALVLGLVSSTIPIEEFHQKVQDLTNYPFRSFALPYLKANLPLLQAELLHFARLAKQSPQQYLRQHEGLLLEGGSPHEPSEIFQIDTKEATKRRTPPESRSRENGYSDNSSDGGPPPAKRPLPSPTLGARISPAGAPNHLPPSLNFRFSEEALYRERDRYERYDRYDREICRPYYGSAHRDFGEDRDMEDEWKNIHTMLICILGMVEKTKRALSILQHRSYAEQRQELALWRRHLDTPTESFDLKKRDLLGAAPHYKAEPELRRQRPPPAVSEVARQASGVQEEAEKLKAEAERSKVERLLSEARRQAAEEAAQQLNHQEDSTENCWNCGRKANETCSGCNVARYCGAFCQHKDWESHLRACGTTPHASPSSSPPAGKQSPPTPSEPPKTVEIK